MQPPSIMELLNSTFSSLVQTCSNIPEDTFFLKTKDEKWSIAEHVHHLILCTLPITNQLKDPALMLHRWGHSNRKSRTLEKFIQDYDEATKDQEWKAFPPFVPLTQSSSDDYLNFHSSKNQVAVASFYHLTGNDISQLPKKVTLNMLMGKEKIMQGFSLIYTELLNRTSSLSEAEMDDYLLPLPYIGMVTFKEILYFTITHTDHHHQSIQHLLKSMAISHRDSGNHT